MPRTDATLAGFVIHEEAPSGLIFRASCVGLPILNAMQANTFAMGCILTDSTTGLAYLNQGTVASPSWVSVNETVPTVPPTTVVTASVTVATTGDTDAYIIAPVSGTVSSILFASSDALAADDTDYITFSGLNMGLDGLGIATLLDVVDGNTTKATGGSAISANTARTLTLSALPANLTVVVGDRIRLRAAATGTLAGTLTNSQFLVRITT